MRQLGICVLLCIVGLVPLVADDALLDEPVLQLSTEDVIVELLLFGETYHLDRSISDLVTNSLPASQLRLIRNMIFARYGRDFNSEDLRRYFASFEWYEPMSFDVDEQITAIDRANIAGLLETERGGSTAGTAYKPGSDMTIALASNQRLEIDFSNGSFLLVDTWWDRFGFGRVSGEAHVENELLFLRPQTATLIPDEDGREWSEGLGGPVPANGLEPESLTTSDLGASSRPVASFGLVDPVRGTLPVRHFDFGNGGFFDQYARTESWDYWSIQGYSPAR